MDHQTLFDSHTMGFFTSLVEKALRGGSSAGSAATRIRRLRTLASTVWFQHKQRLKRNRAAQDGRTVPSILIASITRRCNLNCAGCYSRQLRGTGNADGTAVTDAGDGGKDVGGELSDDRFMEIFREGIDMGVGTLMLAGGEPLLRRSLMRRAAALRGPLIPVFTNGTLLDEEYFTLFASSRLVPIFSIEGDSSFTEKRRGSGIHEGLMEKAAELKRRGILFGFSITLTSGNADQILSPDFLGRVERTGAAVVFLVEYVPVTPGTENLVLTAPQKELLVTPGIFDSFRFSVVRLPGDEEMFGGCLAAGRGFIHIADNGRLEACPFAPFSDTSAADKPLSFALESPLMKAIRTRHAELTETSGGCALWNKRGWVASLGACAVRDLRAEPAPATQAGR